MYLIRKYADNTKQNSVSNRFRRKRINIFLDLIREIPKPVKVLDAGGTVSFWEQMGLIDDNDLDITILNINPESPNHAGVKFTCGDARSMDKFTDKEFDIVFSNSVIEHVGTRSNQKKMADEIMRVGKRYYVQTPNFFFPFEPHFLFPFFQFFPRRLKVFLLTRFSLGWYDKAKDRLEAEKILDSVNLLTAKLLIDLFPKAILHKEKFLILTKSLIVTS